MSRGIGELIGSFVLPLLGGGELGVSAPIRPREHRAMVEQLGELGDPRLRVARLRRAMNLVPTPALPEPGADELGLWIGLHNTLVFDHPERERVWARSITWRRAETMTRGLVTLGTPTDVDEALARHVSVGAFLELERVDTTVPTGAPEELKFRGQTALRRRLLATPTQPAVHTARVRWLEQSHAPDTERLLDDILWASPLTCLLRPAIAPTNWSPLFAAQFLFDRAFARAVCHAWAVQREWIGAGGRLMGGLLASLAHDGSVLGRAVGGPEGTAVALPGMTVDDRPQTIAVVVAGLIHLHFLKVLELDARLGVALGSRDPGVLAFLALPLVLPHIEKVTGAPLSGLGTTSGFEASLSRRWAEYVDHLEELVPRDLVDNLVATVVPRVVQGS